MIDQDDHLPVLAELERLRNADAGLYGRPNWLKARRLVIVAECCKRRYPLIEVMNTDPECVLMQQIKYDNIDAERKPWQGARLADQGIVWLSTFERMAEQGSKQMIPCRHRRWWIPASDVVELRGRHVATVPDNSGRMR